MHARHAAQVLYGVEKDEGPLLYRLYTWVPNLIIIWVLPGQVKSKDREFDSVQHLIKHFTESKLPLVIGSSQVFLKKPVVNAFLNS